MATKADGSSSKMGARANRAASDRAAAAADRETLAILRNPDFETLVRERTMFGWAMSLAMLAVYLTFIFLVAFAPEVMATKLPGGVISLGILLGLCVILFAVLLTGIYVWRANTRFDHLTGALRRTVNR